MEVQDVNLLFFLSSAVSSRLGLHYHYPFFLPDSLFSRLLTLSLAADRLFYSRGCTFDSNNWSGIGYIAMLGCSSSVVSVTSCRLFFVQLTMSTRNEFHFAFLIPIPF